MLVLGLEGSANKLGIGIVNEQAQILANVRHTFVTAPGTGFLPRETSQHHQQWIIGLIKDALHEAGLRPDQLHLIAYTKGPGMGAPLQAVAVVARLLSQIWSLPLRFFIPLFLKPRHSLSFTQQY